MSLEWLCESHLKVKWVPLLPTSNVNLIFQIEMSLYWWCEFQLQNQINCVPNEHVVWISSAKPARHSFQCESQCWGCEWCDDDRTVGTSVVTVRWTKGRKRHVQSNDCVCWFWASSADGTLVCVYDNYSPLTWQVLLCICQNEFAVQS